MGEVYRAHDEKLDREVAIKVLPPGLLGDETARSRFRREAKALSRLTHPHVSTLLDFGSADGVDYLVMELVPGPTLAEALQKGPLPAKNVVRLGTQLARGLKAAHEQGIVHRDLKPSNLCLTGDGLLKILDFGLAQLAPPQSATDETPTETAAGKVVGSPPYMSPEQLLGKDVDARSDVYSAGACLYELATGRRPFGTRSGAALVDAILHETPVPAIQAKAQVPAGLQLVIAKAMDKDADLRYQTAAELLVDLERLQQGSEAGGSASGRGLAAPAASRRRRAWRWAGAGVAAMALVGVAWTLWPRQPPRLLGSRTLVPGLSAASDTAWATDGTRIFYSITPRVSAPTRFFQVPIAGGEPTELPISLNGGAILGYLSRPGDLLINGAEPSDRSDPADGLPLWLANASSGEMRRLGSLRGWRAAVSPDEKRIALVYGSLHAPAIGLADVDGSDPRKVLEIPPWPGTIAWSPDGDRLRFSSRKGPPGHEDEHWIWETSIRGEPPRPLWRGMGGSWTRDGRHFVFHRGVRGSWYPGGGDLWESQETSWRTSGREPLQLSFGPMELWAPGFTPDGRHIFAWGDLLRGELVRHNAATKRRESYLGGMSGHFVDPAPDGQWVAFVSYPQKELWKCRPDGSQRVRLTRPGTQAAFPRWSPDGRDLSFVGFEAGEPGGSVRRVSADGTGEEILARPGSTAWAYWDVCWLPDGEGLVFSRMAGSPGILRMDLRTKQVSPVPGTEKLVHPRCSRQGHLLADESETGGTYVLWRGRKDWVPAYSPGLAYPNWTRDGAAVIGFSSSRTVDRFDFASRRWTTLVDLSDTPLVEEWGPPWVGLAADDSPLFLRDRGTRDLYAFDFEAP
jgi:Tol biopolymer transport system component